MNLTWEQIVSLAPDAKSAENGKKLSQPKNWSGQGHDDDTMWGCCKGSGSNPYQVSVCLATMAYTCTCPSYKSPCKHVLGLMMLSNSHAAQLPLGTSPNWHDTWLQKRRERAANKVAKTAKASADPAAQAKRAAKRQELVNAGIDQLETWMNDLVRNGLAGLESQSSRFWETQVARLVDAKASGLASRVRRLSDLPGASADWPLQMLQQLGRLKLALHAHRQIDNLSQPLQADLRQYIGWDLKHDDVVAHGDLVTDDWLILGQWVNEHEDSRFRTQTNWLLGCNSNRQALILQFAPNAQNFAELIVSGVIQSAELAFYPSQHPQRARFVERHGQVKPIQGALPGDASIDAYFDRVAEALSHQPWMERFACSLQAVIPVCHNQTWYVVDREGQAMTLLGQDHWRLFVLAGGRPIDLAGEWNGHRLRPLGAVADGTYYPC